MKKRKLLFGLWLFILSFFYSPLLSQTHEVQFDHLSEDYYLANSSYVTSLLQDKKGFIWAGTYGGLVRFDGFEEKKFMYEPSDSLSLSDSKIASIIEDSKGYLWITTQSGLDRFDPETETFSRIITKGSNEQEHWGGWTAAIYSSEKNVYLITEKGMCRYDLEKNQFDHSIHEDVNKESYFNVDSLWINNPSLFISNSNNLFLSTKQGIYGLDATTEDFFPITHSSEENLNFDLFDENIFFEDGNGDISIVLNNKMYRYDDISRSITYVNEVPDHLNFLLSKKYHYLKNDVFNRTWVTFFINGIYLVDHKKETVDHIIQNPEKPHQLNMDRINSLIQDDFGNIWVGTGSGLNIYNSSKKKFFNLETDAKSTKVFIKETFEIEEGKLLKWDEGQLMEFNYFQNTKNPFPFKPSSNLEHWQKGVVCYFKDHLGKVWMGTQGGDVFIFDPSTQEFEHKKLNEDNVGRFVVDILEDKNKNVWVSIWNDGVYKYDRKTNTFTHYHYRNNDQNGLVSASGRILFLDNDNTLWYSTRGGLHKYDDLADSFTVYTHDPLDPSTISENTAFSIYESKNGDFWIGTYGGGLNLMDRATGTFKHYMANQGLGDNNVLGIVPDANENLWLFTFDGIYHFNPKTEKFKQFDKKDGLINSGYNAFSFHQSPFNGYSFMEGSNGIDYFHPDSIKDNTYPPAVQLLNLKLNNEDATIAKTAIDRNSNEEFYLDKSITYSDKITIPPSKNVITLEFVAIHFENPNENEYAYQLIGFDKEWQFIGTKREATFTNLKPGNYTFKVKAANSDGVWTDIPAEVELVILPPWYKTWWAYALYFLTIAGLLAWYIRSLKDKVNQKQALLEKEKAFNQKLGKINIANQRFVPKDFLEILGKRNIEDLRLGDQIETEMTILVSDIRAYTTLSETMTPEENFKFINSYLGRVGPIIKKHGGFISQYYGDGLMALFLKNHKAAVNATIEIQQILNIYNKERNRKGRRNINTGIGLNTGKLMLGIIGDKYRYESTVISDAVNIASRMEGLTKIFGASTILSEKTLIEYIENPSDTNTQFQYRYLGRVKVKGKENAIKIYDLYEGDSDVVKNFKKQTKLKFEEGLNYYFSKAFGKSADCFKDILKINGKDKAAQYYLDKSVNNLLKGVEDNWNGVEEMVMK